MRELILVALLCLPVLYGVARVSSRVDHLAREARRR
jgi:hypothetical protein